MVERAKAKATGKEAELKKRLKQKEALAHEYLNDLKRIKAEFENYKKRIEKERAGFVDLATSGLVKRLLPVLDDFERAVAAAQNQENSEKLLQGLELVYSHFIDVLKQEGLTEIDAVGEEFDPRFHEAVLQVECRPDDDGRVVEVMRKGYVVKDQVIRPAMVKVGKSC